MGWLVGKHFFGHNNKHFFLFFFFSVFPLVSGSTLYPDSRFYSSPNSNFLPVPFLQTVYSSILGFLGSQTFSDNKFFIFWLCESCNSVLACSILQCSLPYTYYADSTNRLCDSRILEFISFLGSTLLCCCDWEIPTQYYTQQIILHKNVAL